MKAKLLGAITIAVLLLLVFAVVAQAAVPQSTIDAIIQDAKDGHVDGNWTAAQIGAALQYAENNPILTQYLSLIHISEPTRRTPISYAVFCLKKKKQIDWTP